MSIIFELFQFIGRRNRSVFSYNVYVLESGVRTGIFLSLNLTLWVVRKTKLIG